MESDPGLAEGRPGTDWNPPAAGAITAGIGWTVDDEPAAVRDPARRPAPELPRPDGERPRDRRLGRHPPHPRRPARPGGAADAPRVVGRPRRLLY